MVRRSLLLAFASVLLGLCSAAPASAHTFFSEKGSTWLESEQVTATFENAGSKEEHISCAKTAVGGTMTGFSASQVRLHPVYSNCLAQSGTVVEIFSIGCDYVWSGETDANGHGKVKIECEGTHKIELKVGSFCTAKFGSQTAAAGGVHFENEGTGTGRRYRAIVTASQLKYEMTGMFCSSWFGNGEDGILTENYVVKGFPAPGSKEPIGIWFA
jgi:hypothetical protein